MKLVPDRRDGFGRRRSDLPAPVLTRGLLHDLGHDLATLLCLVDGLLGDPELRGKPRHRVALIGQETGRMLKLVRDRMEHTGPQLIEVRSLLHQVATVTALSQHTRVTVRPGEMVVLRSDDSALWRLLSNLVGNAVRAAGPDGWVELSVTGSPTPVIEIVDDGPGFGHGPAGWGSVGLTLASVLAQSCGAQLHIDPDPDHGARVRVEFADPAVGLDGPARLDGSA